MNDVKAFYDQHHFPGYYSASQINQYDVDSNKYVRLIDRYLNNNQHVLDVGCGTGLLTNLFATRYQSDFTGVDFSTAVDYAKTFATSNNITNAQFFQTDFFEFKTEVKYDVIIAQSFLTHVPDWSQAVTKLKTLLAPNGTMILGIYHTAGKWVQRHLPVIYGNDRLQLDQTANPFEIAFNKAQVLKMFNNYQLLEITPSIGTRVVGLLNLFNARNGGLTMYVLRGDND
jgi:2-polyprenyl-3-methyl-5-hydroxy-6-metoxy-1,4-benzoquinol methylase